jgi:hypothetical protein
MTPDGGVTKAPSVTYNGQMDGGSAQPLPPRPGFGSPTAAARQYVRRHRVLLAVVVVVVVLGGGVAAGAVLLSGSSYVATRPIGAALVKSRLVGAGQTHGRVLVQIGVPTIVRFIPRATFALAVIVTNKAGAPITLERARAILPRQSPLRQIGTRLTPFKPFVCPPGANCPFIDPIGPGPYGVPARPIPLTVEPGHEALAQLHFQFAPCWSKTFGRGATVRRVTVLYRSPDGTAIRQRLPLGDSVPKLTGIRAQPTCRS